MFLCKTPVRIAFGGGGTDVEPYPSEYKGFVVNATINLYFRTIFSTREDKSIRIYSNENFSPYFFKNMEDLKLKDTNDDLIKAILYLTQPKMGMDIYLHGEPPKKAGLGASASLSDCLIAGIQNIQKKEIKKNQIAEMAFKVEDQILNNAGGRQDQYAALFGGFNAITFSGGSNVEVERLKLSDSFIKDLENRIILFYTGEPHTSGNMVKKQIDSYLEEKEESKKSLDRLKEIAFEMLDCLNSEDIEGLGNLLTEDWKKKTKFNPYITTDHMKDLNKIVMNNGGIGGRVCGAGGGGCIFWIVDPKKKGEIIEKLNKKSGHILDFKFENKGLAIQYL
ncbi:MAG: hypothetical protein GF317_17580 [Candidatus Lokiarchaeota archaeon]|nr:hypothetical protein [Candidatus Lokiarchaeota archaeon]MBD3201330.1 hypothetical protein [Candidatus Lokiarchaeota archaeon]